MRTLRCQSKNGVGYQLTSYSNRNKLTETYTANHLAHLCLPNYHGSAIYADHKRNYVRDEQFWGRAVQRAPHGPERDLGRSFHFGGSCGSLARQRISDIRRKEGKFWPDTRLLVNQNGNWVSCRNP